MADQGEARTVDGGWEPWLSDAERAAGVRVIPFSARYPTPTATQLARIAALNATPILVRRDGGVLWFLGLISSEGDRLDNDCNPVEVAHCMRPRLLSRLRHSAGQPGPLLILPSASITKPGH